jgi:hypothetical protein
MKHFYLFICLLLAAPAIIYAQTAKDCAVLVSASVQKSSPSITLHWPKDANSKGYKIWRKAKTDKTWGTLVTTLPATATSYADNTAQTGKAYEYKIENNGTINAIDYQGFGYIYAGAEVPAIENRDKIILLVDNDFKDSLATEINRLEMDMMGDGWQVLTHYVKKTDKVTDVKKVVAKDYNADPAHVKALFLLGHIPVQYSGDYAVDQHIPEHYGAWPADVYYGSFDEAAWTDFMVDDQSADRTENHNVPGDGKFDQDVIPSELKLQIGRVDFYNMPAFNLSETKLIQRYLNKDHNWRVKNYTAKEQGVIEDNFGYIGGEAFAASPFYNFAAMFGDSNVIVKDYLKAITLDTFLWSYGCGGGTLTNAGGIASTSDFVTKKSNTVFTMLFGSWFGDWDNQNNFLRAPLAGDNMTLTNVWNGRPRWNFHHMALGENIGYSTIVTEGDYTNYFRVKDFQFPILANAGDQFVTPALMGDPTLRMHIVAPPTISKIKLSGATAVVSWSKSKDAQEGYYIYRTTDLNTPFVRVASVSATDSVYTDAAPLNASGKNYYMVRAVKLQHSGSGTYYNLSQGSIDSVNLPNGIKENKLAAAIRLYPNPSKTGIFTLELPANINTNYTIQVTDITGRVVYLQQIQPSLKDNKLLINLQNMSKGVYSIQVSNAEGIHTQKIISQ